MKIVMDFRKYDGVVGGVEQGVIQIVKRITEKGIDVVLLSKKGRIDEVQEIFRENKNIKHIPLSVKSHVMSLKNAMLDIFKIQRIAAVEDADLIHFPYNWSFPFRKHVPTVLTVHDVIPFTYREAMGLLRNIFVYKPAIKLACRLNTVITTVSNFSKEDISKKVGVPKQKIRVIYNGIRNPYKPSSADKENLRNRYGIKDGFILNVGGIHERKNIVRLIHAFALLVRRENYEGKLIITGKVSGAPYQEKMKRLCDIAVAEEKLEDRVVFTGFITDEELDTLFSMADIFVYPSLYEGFGIPVLEAMNSGTPVITSFSTALSEVAGDAALLINPEDTEDIYRAMKKLLNDKNLRKELIKKGKKRAAEFSWDKTAEEYLKLYSDIVIT